MNNQKYNGLTKIVFLPLILTSLIIHHVFGQMGNYTSYTKSDRSIIISDASGGKIRITPYGDYIMRIQTVRKNEDFYVDNHYFLVERHDWKGSLDVKDSTSSLTVSTKAGNGISISLSKNPLRLSFSLKSSSKTLLIEKEGTVWSGNTVTESFVANSNEHFAGLGHPKYGRLDKLDRRGTSFSVKSGSEGACVVPFYLSSKGYGVFLNTTFTNTITLCKNNIYSMSINGEGYGGRMDYFFIAGPKLPKIVDRFTQLTGRPRLPKKSIFGLHLSDKTDPNNNGEAWWKSMINNHRKAGYPFDHQVNDNAWRASNGQYSTMRNSWFAWRTKDRYPDPKAYSKWLDSNGVTMTLDLNRPGIDKIPSWKKEYGIPGTSNFPDFTNPKTVKWIWDLFYNVAFNPTLGCPGDAIWLDEFDYPDHNHSIKLANGRRWAEESINYHFMLLKACVENGWDPTFGETRRPYFWVRGITTGAQRYGIHWTGDLCDNWKDMVYQVRAMQSSGISGFPYFNHDAGAHFNVCGNSANHEKLFRQWDMGFGSLTPIWKPHGPSHKRWPLQQNSQASKDDAMKYGKIRYEMIPYIYSYAIIAALTGMPMVRSMFFEDPANETAWQKDMQYYWGKEILIAPNCSDGNNNVSVWLPEGGWYDFWNDKKMEGNRTIDYYAAVGVMPIFVKEGAIIPKAPYAKSTFRIPKDSLNIHIYAGADGEHKLYEDDGTTEKYRTKNEIRTTLIEYKNAISGVTVNGAEGKYDRAPDKRAYSVIYHGFSKAPKLFFNNSSIKWYANKSEIPHDRTGIVWDNNKKLATVVIPSQNIKSSFIVSTDQNATGIRSINRRNLTECSIFFNKNKFTIYSASDIGPVSFALFRMNGQAIRKMKIAKPKRSGSGYSYLFKYQSLTSGLYIAQIKSGYSNILRQVLIR